WVSGVETQPTRLAMERPSALPDATAALEQITAAWRPSEPASTPRAQGHRPKLDRAVGALTAAGRLPPDLRPSERDERIRAWLKGAGYRDHEIPDRTTIWRYFRR